MADAFREQRHMMLEHCRTCCLPVNQNITNNKNAKEPTCLAATLY